MNCCAKVEKAPALPILLSCSTVSPCMCMISLLKNTTFFKQFVETCSDKVNSCIRGISIGLFVRVHSIVRTPELILNAEIVGRIHIFDRA